MNEENISKIATTIPKNANLTETTCQSGRKTKKQANNHKSKQCNIINLVRNKRNQRRWHDFFFK